MSEDHRRAPGSVDTSVPTLLLCALAGLLVPPSGPLPGISDLERQLLTLVLPCLLAAMGLGLVAVVASLVRKHRFSGLFGVLSLLLINVAALLSGQYGLDGVGVVVTLLVTSPLAAIMAARESAWRRQGLEA